jgi:Ca2+-binding RTX toxin-like protein
MAAGHPGVRQALVSTSAAAVLAVCCAAPAQARTRCSYSGPPDNLLTVTADRGALAQITRRGDRIVAREFLGASARCTGGVPTVLNTDTIRVNLRTDDDFVDVFLGGGPFAPGVTAEEEGASEIEIEVTTPGRFGSLATVHGTRKADEFHWGPGVNRNPGLNLNPLTSGDSDVDVTTTGTLDLTLVVEAAGGDDKIIPAPGAPFPNLGVFTFGGPGNDRLSALPNGFAILDGQGGADVLTGADRSDNLIGEDGDDRVDGAGGGDFIVGGPGRDLLRAGPGRDRISARDSRRDRVFCGAGRDRVEADRLDRLRGCERVRR